MVCQQEYTERNSTERDNNVLPADACRASWERLLGLAGGTEMVGPITTCSAEISLATHMLELLESSTAPARDLHPGDS